MTTMQMIRDYLAAGGTITRCEAQLANHVELSWTGTEPLMDIQVYSSRSLGNRD